MNFLPQHLLASAWASPVLADFKDPLIKSPYCRSVSSVMAGLSPNVKQTERNTREMLEEVETGRQPNKTDSCCWIYNGNLERTILSPWATLGTHTLSDRTECKRPHTHAVRKEMLDHKYSEDFRGHLERDYAKRPRDLLLWVRVKRSVLAFLFNTEINKKTWCLPLKIHSPDTP